jgi:hypothetical protein
LSSFNRRRNFIVIHHFWSDWFISFIRKKHFNGHVCLYFKHVEYRVSSSYKVCHSLGLNAIDISKELGNVYLDSASSCRTVAKWEAELKDPKRGVEDAPLIGRSSTMIINENIKAVEQIVMRDRQISVRRVSNELGIPKTSGHKIMNDYLGMKKVSTRWAST